MAEMTFKIKWETRLCEVDEELGYFHTWEQWSNVVNASPLRGGVILEEMLVKFMGLSNLRMVYGVLIRL